MNPLRPFYNMKIGIVDLSVSSVEVIPLVEEQVGAYLGGAAMNMALHAQHKADPLVFGTGLLTGSFAPASSLMTVSFVSPIFNRMCHVPLMLRTGPDMKFSGVDYLIVKGTAPELSILNVNNGKIHVLPAGNLENRPVPEVIGELKKASSAFQSLIATGPAADHGISCASVSIGINGSLDKVGLASFMSTKNLKGIILGGTGGLPFDRDNPDQGKEVEKIISKDKNFKHRGFYSILKNLEGGRDAGRLLKAERKKDMACYHCPSPCMTHVSYSLDDPGNKEKQKSGEGLLLLDHTGCIALAKKVGKNVLPVLRACLYCGLDPTAVSEMLPQGQSSPYYLSALDKIISDNPAPATGTSQRLAFSGGGIPSMFEDDLMEKRVGLAMILGVCPVFLLRFPRITDTALLSFISTKEKDLRPLHERLSSAIASLLTE